MASIEGIFQYQNARGASVQSQLRQDELANLLVSQSLPRYTDLAINRRLFTANALTGTHAAPAIAPLTTNAQHILHNSGSGKVLIPIRAWIVLESGTRAIGTSVWVAASNVEESTAPTEYTNSSGSIGLAGGSSADGLYDNVITLGTAPGWICWAANDSLADANESSAIVLEFDGEFSVEPKFNFVMSIRDSAAGTTPLYSAGFLWAEVPLTQS